MASTKPLLRKRLNLGEGDEGDEDGDGQDITASVTGTGSASFKLQKTAKKRVNPFKTASINAKPRISSLPPPPPPPSAPQSKLSASTKTPEPTPTTNTTNANTTNTTNTTNPNETEEEDDYLSMSLTTLPPTSTSVETYTQRRLRLTRESEARARIPSKAELAQQEKQRREEGLARSLLEDKSSKGYRMMKAMGWKGEGLGKAAHYQPPKQPVAQDGEEEDGDIGGDGVRLGLGCSGGAAASDTTPQQHQQPHRPILEPIALSIKEDRAGIGHLTSEKHKFRESLHRSGISPTANPTPPPHELAESYRTRLRLDKQEKRAEAQFYSAQTILEGFDRGESQTSSPSQSPQSQREFSPLGSRYPPSANKDTTAPFRAVPLKSIPLLYRSLVLHRESKDRQKCARYEFMNSLSSATYSTSKPLNLPGYERDAEDKIVFGTTQMIEDDGDLEEDEELEEFNQLPFTERLGMIVSELRERWKYCFWCKYRYASQEEVDESCPGLGEDVHG